MKPNKSDSQWIMLAILSIFLVDSFWPVYAKDKGCWGDFYDKAQYKGQHIRIKGPAKLKNLGHVQGEDWNSRIQSLMVGPEASVTVFDNENFKLVLTDMANHPNRMKSLGISKQDILEDSELIFKPGSKIHNLEDFEFNPKIKSLKIDCVD